MNVLVPGYLHDILPPLVQTTVDARYLDFGYLELPLISK